MKITIQKADIFAKTVLNFIPTYLHPIAAELAAAAHTDELGSDPSTKAWLSAVKNYRSGLPRESSEARDQILADAAKAVGDTALLDLVEQRKKARQDVIDAQAELDRIENIPAEQKAAQARSATLSRQAQAKRDAWSQDWDAIEAGHRETIRRLYPSDSQKDKSWVTHALRELAGLPILREIAAEEMAKLSSK